MTIPLETLLSLFQNPLHLIQKRKDKLLDYDRMQYALDHAEDSEKISQLREEVLLARRNYEALNTQLLEELPLFIESVATMLQHQLARIMQAQYTFCSSVSALLPPLLPSQPTTSAEIEQEHAEELLTICKELAKLSLVPASLSYIRTGGGVSAGGASDSNSPVAKTGGQILADTAVGKEMVEEEEEEMEGEERTEEVPPKGTRLQVLFEFVSEDPAELSVSVGQSVELLCGHDRIGCKEWWLVQGQDKKQGYVPATYLDSIS